MKFTWNGDVPHSSAGWGWPFPVRAICLHLERDSAPQIPVEGMHVPGEFHGRGIDEEMRTGTAAGIYESGCYGHCCGELDQRALLAVADVS